MEDAKTNAEAAIIAEKEVEVALAKAEAEKEEEVAKQK